MLQMRLRLPHIPRPPQPKAAHPLRERALYARARRIRRLEGVRRLVGPRGQQRGLLCLRLEGQAPPPLRTLRTLRLQRTGLAVAAAEGNLNPRRARGAVILPPALTGMAPRAHPPAPPPVNHK